MLWTLIFIQLQFLSIFLRYEDVLLQCKANVISKLLDLNLNISQRLIMSLYFQNVQMSKYMSTAGLVSSQNNLYCLNCSFRKAQCGCSKYLFNTLPLLVVTLNKSRYSCRESCRITYLVSKCYLKCKNFANCLDFYTSKECLDLKISLQHLRQLVLYFLFTMCTNILFKVLWYLF